MTRVDPARLPVAAHELGHALIWQLAGLPIKDIRVTGRNGQIEGQVDTELPAHPTREQARLLLVGFAAGRAAGVRWCEQHNMVHDEGGCERDEKNFRAFRRDLRMTELTRNQARAEARRLVRAKWGLIVRLAPRLARTGTITL